MTAVDTLIANVKQNRFSELSEPLIATVDNFVAALQQLSIAAGGAFQQVTISGLVLGAASTQSFLNVGGTWNDAGTAFKGAVLVNVTDTASAAGSLLLDLQDTNVSKFSVDKAGNVSTATGMLHNAPFTGAYVDGIVIDYNGASTSGRISVGPADYIRFFNGGVANTLLGYFDPSGNFFANSLNTINVSLGAGSVASFADIIGTWNDAGTTFKGALLVNVTNTASAAGSLLIDLQASGVSKFSVDKAGNIAFAGTLGLTSLVVTGGTLGAGSTASFATITGTWNDLGTVFRAAVLVNITNTNSNPGSLLLDLQVGGASQYKITRQGNVTCGSLTCGPIDMSSSGSNGVTIGANANIIWNGGTVISSQFSNGKIRFATNNGASYIELVAPLGNGAAAQTATLTNGPTAGNPTKWFPINDSGTTRYVPSW